MTDKQIIEPCMGCSALECWGVVDCDVAQRVLALHKTLTEIKEIAENCMKQDICTTCDNSDKCHIEDEEIPTYDVCKLIIQRVSEVEEQC